MKDGLADLEPVFGKMRWMPVACYLFATVIIIDPRKKTFYLCLTEDRQLKKIWTPFGGEVSYKNEEQFSTAAIREAIERKDIYTLTLKNVKKIGKVPQVKRR